MSAVAVFRLPLTTDLSGFVGLLQRLHVPHRVSEDGSEQVLWVPNAKLAEDIRTLYQRFPDGDPTFQIAAVDPGVTHVRPGFVQQVRESPVTALVLLLSLIVAAVTLLGDNLEPMSWLTFVDFSVHGDYVQFVPLENSLAAGQWWRIITPMLVHFGVLHLAMNAMWFWELGRRIEARQGSWHLLGLTLVFSAFSNYAQYWYSGPSLFGGLSGVLYALLGHCWFYQMIAPNPIYRLPRGVLVMMLVWLVICISGVVGALGFGQIANGAHVGGLIIGCATGLLGGVLARRNR
ncbi:rhomboid family intramembrane serine protease [Pseudomonas sp. NA-150]|uniref:rhomboid family intramembrane serine protease n=1 Tax=Pseudomonas sp. NA-150 TaxID=3367525 RepID=UPI0037CC9055